MEPGVREMRLEEAHVIVDYFHRSTPGHLELLGVDRAKLPERTAWLDYYARQFALPVAMRDGLLLIWASDAQPIGVSTADRIVPGQEAFMHLHIFEPDRRRSGTGSRCVRESAKIYFDRLQLQRLFCEPNAFNVAPNRALQAAGFRYVKTHMTVPGPLNHHQAVTQWVLDNHRGDSLQ